MVKAQVVNRSSVFGQQLGDLAVDVVDHCSPRHRDVRPWERVWLADAECLLERL
ncbi:hypothetical protein AB0M87_09900 [Streptomyces sp. NPDC051320]|uniref:hypothetical protein n=1 Tax=Streptomyces sp. NPDC051320 TaxID=3154644 RepID=UPI0034326DEB